MQLQQGNGAQEYPILDQGAQNHHHEGQTAHNDEWHHTLCGCCASCELCLMGTFLPCLLLGKTSHRLREPSMESYEPINRECVLMTGITYITGFGWMYVMRKRAKIRELYGIKGSDARDCCASYWCASSALIQHEREVLHRQVKDPIVQGYYNQPAMEMPAR
ncbi:PLAC8 family protein [Colletotrichum tofieldiae]|uniref:PLAC8 family protein n=1 Tax=Colletotrichum tofieldiae TaxID=708197 RepID=A0A161VEP9_9PEZI|nr:PLAC8 family protein [Colletotrichum tofieldiae]